MIPSSNLGEHTLQSCLRNTVRAMNSRSGNDHLSSWNLSQSFAPSVDHECTYIFTLPKDNQVSDSAQSIMMEDIRACEDDAMRLQARARIVIMALSLGLEVVGSQEMETFFYMQRGLLYCSCTAETIT